jgi:glycine betaine catabolism B
MMESMRTDMCADIDLEAPVADVDDSAAAESSEAGIGVRILPQGVEIFVRPGETILEAGLRSGVALANSCREGMCGTCRMRKLSGEVEMREQSALFDDEIEAGDILACCSRPLTPVVVECT